MIYNHGIVSRYMIVCIIPFFLPINWHPTYVLICYGVLIYLCKSLFLFFCILSRLLFENHFQYTSKFCSYASILSTLFCIEYPTAISSESHHSSSDIASENGKKYPVNLFSHYHKETYVKMDEILNNSNPLCYIYDDDRSIPD